MPPDLRQRSFVRGLPAREPAPDILAPKVSAAKRAIRILVLTAIFTSGWFGYQSWVDWRDHGSSDQGDAVLDGPMHPPVLTGLTGPSDRPTPTPGSGGVAGRSNASSVAQPGPRSSSPSAFERGTRLVSRREYEKAIPYLLSAVSENDSDTRARYQLGVALAACGHTDAAEEQRRALLAIDPNAARSLQAIIADPSEAHRRIY